jgi:N-acetylneuraminate synthase
MVFITAEIGINHNGDIEIAKKLIDIAISAGCDAVKFQKRTVDNVYSKELLESPRDSPWGKTQRAQKEGLEFSKKQFKIIDSYCKRKNITWFVSCWDVDSQIQMQEFNLKFNKVPSAMLIHTKLLETIAKERKHTFISTGMSTMKEIQRVIDIFKKHKCPFELMHAHSAYPMPYEEANIKVIKTLRDKFKCDVGYSGHEAGSYLICIIAVMMGATSIERHITLDRAMYGSDQASSLEPEGLFRMVKDLRNVEKIIGDGKKHIWDSEIPAKNKLREILG